MSLWFLGMTWLPLILAIVAMLMSFRTRKQLKQEVARLETIIFHARNQGFVEKSSQTSAPSHSVSENASDELSASQVQSGRILDDDPIDALLAENLLNSQVSAIGRNQENLNAQTVQPEAKQQQAKNSNSAWLATGSSTRGSAPLLEPDEYSLNIVTSVWHSFLQWFKGGNAIVRVGVIVLLVGIVLLLRLANELFTVPIEVRLGAVALGGVALTLIGLKLRQKRYGYAISLQGAGLAIVYFTLFAAYRLYDILPPSLAFALLAILAVVSAAFALMQNALPLALLAFGGGFLAPLLTSTGNNNLVGLFSYYLLLNVALAWLAHYKTWKVLNVLGALMTFGLAGFLGWSSYAQDMRWPLEALLLAHLGLYLFIVVRYSQQLLAAQQQMAASNSSDQLASIASVDSTLLFGVPLMGFALQAGLLRDIPYALALSSAALSGIYLLLGYRLFNRNKQLRVLTEGILALGIGFMALVIPLALNAEWTTVGWAVQGAALVWLGQQQGRIWSVRFGILLQLLSGGVLAWLYLDQGYIVLPLLVYSVCLFICALLLRRPTTAPIVGIALTASNDPTSVAPAFGTFKSIIQPSFVMLVWAFVASQFSLVELEGWLGAADYYWPISHLALGFYPLIFGMISVVVGWKLVWPQLSYLLQWLITGVTIYAGLLWLDYYPTLLDDKLLLLGLITSYAVFGYLLLVRYQRQQLPIRVLQAIFIIGLLIFSSVWWLVNWSAEPAVAGVILPLIILAALLYFKSFDKLIKPQLLLQDLSIPVSIVLMLWMAAASQQASGQLFGWWYVPFLNLLDVCFIAAGIVVYYLLAYLPSDSSAYGPSNTTLTYFKKGMQLAFGIAGFIVFTGMIIRTLHQWAGTPLWADGAWHNDLVQTSLTIVWTLCALVLTGLASRYAWREIWLVGIALLVIVVAKLLFIDLSNAATVARIVSFIGAGLIMLLIGYIAPLPPSKKELSTKSQQSE